MWWQIIILALELILLFLLSRLLIKQIHLFFILALRNRTVAATLIILLLFPGTVIHELSHLFMAGILGVPTGKITLTPDSIRGEEIVAGSVKIAQTGPLRRFLIGISPTIGGILLLTAISALVTTYFGTPYDIILDIWTSGLILKNFFIYILLIYLIFSISNSMFSSSEDLKGALGVIFLLAIFIITFIFIGININLTGRANEYITIIFSTINQAIAIVLIINLILFILAKIVIHQILHFCKLQIIGTKLPQHHR